MPGSFPGSPRGPGSFGQLGSEVALAPHMIILWDDSGSSYHP